jgi:tetratricopeptide (TPR) repeat protein
MMRRWIITGLVLMVCPSVFGQLYPERRDVRRGNRAWEREDYAGAEGRYTGALSKNPASAEANFNLGDVYYRQGRFEEAEQSFGQAGQIPAPPEQSAQAFYNQGNAQVRQYKSTYNKEKLTRALEVYKQSLRLNPDDQQAKFNLAYVQKLLENENGGGGGGGDQNQDQNQDPNQNQNQDQNPDSGENEGKGDPNDPQEDENEGQQPEGGMNRQEAEQMLEAIQNGEEGAREKMEGEPATAVGRSGKNW